MQQDRQQGRPAFQAQPAKRDTEQHDLEQIEWLVLRVQQRPAQRREEKCTGRAERRASEAGQQEAAKNRFLDDRRRRRERKREQRQRARRLRRPV
jgi:hypothetical protein